MHGEQDDHSIGDFENFMGEHWVFTRDRETGVAILGRGDIGWSTSIDVADGTTGMLSLNRSEVLGAKSFVG